MKNDDEKLYKQKILKSLTKNFYSSQQKTCFSLPYENFFFIYFFSLNLKKTFDFSRNLYLYLSFCFLYAVVFLSFFPSGQVFCVYVQLNRFSFFFVILFFFFCFVLVIILEEIISDEKNMSNRRRVREKM